MLNNLKNKKILITGNTGFKGAWLTLFLNILGAKVVGYSNVIPWRNSILTKKNINIFAKQYWGDITDFKKINKLIISEKPDLVFHLAAQPLVLEGFKNPYQTMMTNINGTINILEAVKINYPNTPLMIITSDKVYENDNNYNAFKEDDHIYGDCPYSTSKACSEMISKTYFNIKKDLVIRMLRAGNVIGGGDWSEDRLIPDLIRSILKKEIPLIRNPKSVRPWTHVLDIIYGYVLAANNSLKEKKSYDAFNFSSNTKHDYNVLKIANKFLNKFNLNALKIDKRESFIEKTNLCIDSNKSKEILDWHPTYEIEDVINLTVEWYDDIFKKKLLPIDKTIQQIQSYLNNLQESKKLNLRKAI